MVARAVRKINKPTRWPNGLNDQFVEDGPLKNWAQIDPLRYVTWAEDFFRYAVAEWTITKTGTGTNALSATAAGGVLNITNTAGATDAEYFQPAAGLPFNYTLGKYLAGRMRFQVDDASLAAIEFGLQAANTTPFTIVNGIMITKPAGGTTFSTFVTASSTSSSATGLGTLVANTWTEIGFVYDPRNRGSLGGGANGEVLFFLNGAFLNAQPLTNAPSVVLTPTFGLLNGSAVARTMLIDNFLYTMERT